MVGISRIKIKDKKFKLSIIKVYENISKQRFRWVDQ